MPITGLIVGGALGFAMQRGRFCVTTAFRDVWIGGKTRWITAFGIAIAVQSIGVFAMQSAGLVSLQADQLALWPTIVGSFVFGFAIVLAAGCAPGTFFRPSEGVVGSWFALLVYAGFSAIRKYGVVADFTTTARAETIGLTTVQETLDISPWALVALLSVGAGALAGRHLAAETKLATLPPQRRGIARLLFEQPWHAFATATIIRVIAAAAWPLSAAS